MITDTHYLRILQSLTPELLNEGCGLAAAQEGNGVAQLVARFILHQPMAAVMGQHLLNPPLQSFDLWAAEGP